MQKNRLLTAHPPQHQGELCSHEAFERFRSSLQESVWKHPSLLQSNRSELRGREEPVSISDHENRRTINFYSPSVKDGVIQVSLVFQLPLKFLHLYLLVRYLFMSRQVSVVSWLQSTTNRALLGGFRTALTIKTTARSHWYKTERSTRQEKKTVVSSRYDTS